MSTIPTIDPFRTELEYERSGRSGRGASMGSRGGQAPRLPRPSKPPSAKPPYSPAWRRRRIGGWGHSSLAPLYDEPGPDRREPTADGEPARSGSSEYVRWVQHTLNGALGMSLAVDGVMTDSLRRWIRVFQRQSRLPVSGFIGPDTEAALRRVRRNSEQREFEFEWELSGAALTADNALALSKAVPVASALKSLRALGKDKIAGLYRFYTSAGKFYTGKAMDLRSRILQHMWCLSHLGKTTRGMKLALYPMKGSTDAQVRPLEKKINEHHMKNNKENLLNKVTELEVLELNEI